MSEAELLEKIDRLRAENERLRAALIDASDVLVDVVTSYKGSIGSIDNVYLAQIGRVKADRARQAVWAALETSTRDQSDSKGGDQ